jgi:lysyl-tRNA synthetase class 2
MAFRDWQEHVHPYTGPEGPAQVYVRKMQLKAPDYADSKKFDKVTSSVSRQDFQDRPGADGSCRTDCSVDKSLRPLPEKAWAQDVEERYRHRYVDLIVNEKVREVFVRRARIIEYIRKFLANRDFIEVETPDADCPGRRRSEALRDANNNARLTCISG